MSADLSFDPSTIPVDAAANFINGRRVVGRGVTVPVVRSSDGCVDRDLLTASVEQVAEAAESAHRAFLDSGWASCSPRDRIRVLRRWADLIEADVHALARIESFCSTRPIAETTAWDVPNTAECLRFFSELADKSGGEVASTRTDNLGLILRQPYGVIGAIAPWNFPMSTAMWKIAPALAAGNAIVIKPSEMTPFSTVRLAELAIEAGLPAGLLNVVQGLGAPVGDALVRDPHVSKVTFTGSTRTGAAIMTACAESGIKPSTLELGGKSPQLVFQDIPDVGRTAQAIARSITGNAGQVCVAGSRLVVHESIAEEMIARIIACMVGLRAGATWESQTTLSPIINSAQCDKIEAMVERAKQAGAEAVTGGRRLEAAGNGAFYQPTILCNVTVNSEIIRDEVFGPVLTVQTFRDEEEGFALADHPHYGLAAGVHTSNIDRALRAIRKMEAGTVWVNRYGRSGDFILPTGGFKSSGIGRDLGRQAFEANQHIKTALVDFAEP